jgi:hypothetical protein
MNDADSNSKSVLDTKPFTITPDTRTRDSKIVSDKEYSDFLRSLEQPKLPKTSITPPVSLIDESWFKPGKYNDIYSKEEMDKDLQDIHSFPEPVKKQPIKAVSRPRKVIKKPTRVKDNYQQPNVLPSLSPSTPSVDLGSYTPPKQPDTPSPAPKKWDKSIEIFVPTPDLPEQTKPIVDVRENKSSPTPKSKSTEIIPKFNSQAIQKENNSQLNLPEPTSSPDIVAPFPNTSHWPKLETK